MKNFRLAIKETLRKNRDEVAALLTGEYPAFVYSGKAALGKYEIPVFTFHDVQTQTLETVFSYIRENGYLTIGADELYEIIIQKKENNEKKIAVTFDDGLSSLWTHVFPLARKYGIKIISFIVPYYIGSEDTASKNLEDVWNGRATIGELNNEKRKKIYCTWKEIKLMHKSGFVDFQSHTYKHCTVFSDDRLVHFITPEFYSDFIHHSFNNFVENGSAVAVPLKAHLGYPVYNWESSFTAEKAFLANEATARSCMNFVKSRGAEKFFNEASWKRELVRHYKNYIKYKGPAGSYMEAPQRRREMTEDLIKAKSEIEQRIEKEVRHLSYPWYMGSELSVAASEAAGMISNFWGIRIPAAHRSQRDPYYIRRIPSECFIMSLPGNERRSLAKILLEKYFKQKRTRK